MTVAGSDIDMRGLEPFELTPAHKARREYVRNLASEVSALDGIRRCSSCTMVTLGHRMMWCATP